MSIRDWNGHVPDTEAADPDRDILKRLEQLEQLTRTVLTKLEQNQQRDDAYDAIAIQAAISILDGVVKPS
jgi:hypothetical protein